MGENVMTFSKKITILPNNQCWILQYVSTKIYSHDKFGMKNFLSCFAFGMSVYISVACLEFDLAGK